MRVLVVDDEPDIRQLLAKALTGRGIDVDVEACGQGALARLRERRYDSMLLDVRMPQVSGADVLPQALELQPQLPVLMVSALNEPRLRVRCLEQGAVDYVTKPFVLAELIARLRVHTRPVGAAPPHQERRVQERRTGERRDRDVPPRSGPTEGATSSWLRAGRLALDPRRRVVRSGGATAELTEREALVLSHLVRRAGDVCSRDEILADVWGADGHDGNLVDVYVGRLRAKLPPDSITTVRNAGYAVSPA